MGNIIPFLDYNISKGYYFFQSILPDDNFAGLPAFGGKGDMRQKFMHIDNVKGKLSIPL